MRDYEVTPPPDRLADRVQIRTGSTTERGEVVRFMVQLEYWSDGGWRPVVRYDHDRDAEGGHDITDEGLHMDIYRDGEKVDVKDVSGPIPAAEGFDHAKTTYVRTCNDTSRGSSDGTAPGTGTTCERRRTGGDARPNQ